jgi:hypothetical protein
LALLATARTRPFIDLFLTLPPRYRVRPVIGPPDFLRDPLGALFFVARLALEALLLDARRALEEFAPLRRAEGLRERPVVEPLLRGLPRDPTLPLRFTFV